MKHVPQGGWSCADPKMAKRLTEIDARFNLAKAKAAQLSSEPARAKALNKALALRLAGYESAMVGLPDRRPSAASEDDQPRRRRRH